MRRDATGCSLVATDDLDRRRPSSRRQRARGPLPTWPNVAPLGTNGHGRRRPAVSHASRAPAACPRASPPPWRSGSPLPSSISSAPSRCGSGIRSAHGSPSPSSPTAFRMVKSRGVTASRSSQATGNDTGHAGSQPRAVRGHHGRPAGPGGVEEHLPAAVLDDVRGGGEDGIDPFGSRGDRPGRGGHLLGRGLRRDRNEHVHALRSAGLGHTDQAGIGQGLAHQVGRADRRPERVPLRRVEVQDQIAGVVPVAGAHQGRVVLHRALVGEPEQCPAVVAQRVGHLALGGLRPHRHGLDPVRRVLRHVLLHERLLAAQHPHHRQRPVAQAGDDPVPHGVQVLDEIPLGRVGPVEQRLVEIGQRHSGSLVVAHRLTFPMREREVNSAAEILRDPQK